VVSFLIFKSSLTTAFIAIIGTLVVFMPIIMRLSRNIWINLFMNYDKNLAKK
jgi:ABC-type long-subunit fatty acid transport system fused permease/ATPase subunit